MGQTALPSTMATQDAISTSTAGKETPLVGGDAGVLWSFAAMFARRKDINKAMDEQRALHNRPNLPHCCLCELMVPRSFTGAVRSEHSHLWLDAVARRLRDSSTRGYLRKSFKSATLYEGYIGMCMDSGPEYGRPTTTKARPDARGGQQRSEH